MSDQRQFQITETQVEALKELINIGVGQGAEVLNSMLNSHINLSVPLIKFADKDSLSTILFPEIDSNLSAVEMKYRGSFSGNVELIFPKQDAAKLVTLLLGESFVEGEMDEIRSSTLQEIGNVLLNAVMGTISNFFSFSLRYSLPSYQEGNIEDLLSHMDPQKSSVIICAHTTFSVANKEIEGILALFFALETFDELMEKINTYSGVV